MKEKKLNINNIIAFVYIFVGLFLIVTNGIQAYATYSNERRMLSNFYQNDKKNINNVENKDSTKSENSTEEKEENNDYLKDSPLDEYISVIKIPKINLEKGLFSKESKYNDVEYNIMIHEKSDDPTVEKGNIILVAHSGTSEISYFKNLNSLIIGDKVEIYYHGLKYIYKLSDIYEVEKVGKVEIKRDSNKNTLTMITCKHNTNLQVVYISELDSVEEY